MVASSELWWICSSTISGSGIRLATECRRREVFVGSVRSVRNALATTDAKSSTALGRNVRHWLKWAFPEYIRVLSGCAFLAVSRACCWTCHWSRETNTR
jgi:hypothetical protein